MKSNNTSEEAPPPEKTDDDLEDGEIEDDDEEEVPQENATSTNSETSNATTITTPTTQSQTSTPTKHATNDSKSSDRSDREKNREKSRDRSERRSSKHEEKGRKHMTEAEKSILHLRRREKMQREREKWEKYRKEHTSGLPTDPLDDDFAKNIEKTLATILSKKEKQAAASEDDKDDEKRGRKRKKHDKDRQKNKQRRTDSPRTDDVDESEMLNVRGGSPEKQEEKRDRDKDRDRDRDRDRSITPHSNESYDSEYSSDRSKEDSRSRKRDSKRNRRSRERRERKNREREREQRERRAEAQLKDAQGVCVFYLQGKCQKNDCPYSHEAVPPMKLELCKFYLMDCCAKGEKCSYMHSEFPCKFYHTGLQCTQGENCKFAHGKPLTEGLKQILFKHIETAPRDILGGFPRMSREEALAKINESQKNLQEQYGMIESKSDVSKGLIPSLFEISVPVPLELQGSEESKTTEKNDKPARNRRSRWQDPDPEPPKESQQLNFPKPFTFNQDQDMRISSNGDVDMRTLPPTLANLTVTNVLPLQNLQNLLPHRTPDIPVSVPTTMNTGNIQELTKEIEPLSGQQDTDIRNAALVLPNQKDLDIRLQPPLDPRVLSSKDVDIRQFSNMYDDNNKQETQDNETEDEPMLQIDTGEEQTLKDLPPDLPKTQRNLFMRIQAQQKENVPEENKTGFEIDENINWYSDDDDDDDNKLTIKDDNDDIKEKDDSEHDILSPTQIKPQEVVEKLGDLSKIDISAEVTKLLTSMSQAKNAPAMSESKTSSTTSTLSRDPRISGESRTIQDPRILADPRRARVNSTENKSEKLSIYEQGSIDGELRSSDNDSDNREEFKAGTRSDVDLRNLQLPFKMQNYTPATEIDASVNSHPPLSWKVFIVEIPRPDYTGLKLSVSDAEKTGDPRLRKIFRLSTDEKDSPASPKASPKASSGGGSGGGGGGSIRIDPRLRKVEEAKSADLGTMNYNQQLTMLQSSAFYQSLTSNQKLLLNQELAARTDQTSGSHDPLLNTLLSNLNLIPGTANIQSNPNLGAALNILASVTKLNPAIITQPPPQTTLLTSQVNPAILGQNPNLMNQMAQSIVQPGLLGAAPGIPNLPPDFQINFDPRNGGLLGNAPPPFETFSQDGGGGPPGGGNFNNFNDDFYPDNGNNNFGPNNNNNRNFMRDRRRGRNNNFGNRNNGNRNFRNRNSRSNNRGHTPP